jgi:twinkle protein
MEGEKQNNSDTLMETVISLATMNVYDITADKHGENQMPCPECSPNRRKKNVKCFSYNVEKEIGFCNHCEARFVKHNPYEKKEYIKPVFEFQNFTKLSDNVVKWFEGRGISQRTLLAMKISEKREYMPQTEKEENCIVFPFFKNSELINLKFRDARKNFKLSSGAELIWFNYDAILKHEDIIICEGEIDALSFIQAGFENVISVPNGANIGKMEYFDSSFEDLNKVKTFVIAVDNDLKGIELKQDLVRRLGMERCKTASFKQFKDVNELLVSEGIESVQNAVKSAKLMKLSDIYEVEDFRNELNDYFENGMPQGKTLGIPELDKIIRWQTGRFGVATGIPGMGKSEFLDFVYCRLNILYNWPIGYYSPESMPLQQHFSKIFPKFVGKDYKKGVVNDNEKYTGEEYINKNVFWVNPPVDMDIDGILSRFEYLVKAKGCKAFVIDPFNRIEQSANHSDNERLFIKKNLVKMSNFTKRTDSLLFLVAHPTKMTKDKDDIKYKIPGPYNISGSADFLNMCDYTLTVHRGQDSETGKYQSFGYVIVQKAKINKTMGDTGSWNYWYNINNGRYITDHDDGKPRQWDNSNWITNEEYYPPEEPEYTVQPATTNQAFGDEYAELPF